MKINLLVLFTVFTGHTVCAQNFQWAKSIGLSNDENSNGIVLDAAGNVYTTGNFSEVTDFDPGSGTFELTPAGQGDIFVLKLDAAGNFLWAKSMGGVSDDQANALAIDILGNLYVTGKFLKTADFDPSEEASNLISAGGGDVFVVKLTGDGNFTWAKKLGGAGNDVATSIAVDPLGNVYTTGYFRGTCDFDPGDAVSNLTSIGATNYDPFISKLDATGNFVYAKNVGGSDDDRGSAIAVDALGNAYVTGFFWETVDFDPGDGIYNLTPVKYEDAFVLKLDPQGSFVWAHNVGGDNGDRGISITLDADANVYSTGYYGVTVDFDPGAATFALSAASYDVYVWKLDKDGNFVWAQSLGGSMGQEGWAISVDAARNVYTTGYFTGTADFDPGPETYNLVEAGAGDVFISKLDAMGHFVWAKRLGGNNVEHSRAIVADNSGNVYTTGDYQGTADFDPNEDVYEFVAGPNGYANIFISKLGSTALPVSLLVFELLKKENSTQLTWTTAIEINTKKFEVERSIGGAQFIKIGEVNANGNSTSISTYNFTDKNIAADLSETKLYYRLKQFDLNGDYTFSAVRFISLGGNRAIQIYPNPTKNSVTLQISNTQIGLHYSVTDLTGKTIKTGRITGAKTTINISQLAAGLYTIKLENGAGSFKLFKQ